MYHFRSLQEITMEQLADCFNSAFSDYEQPIRFTPASMNYYLTAGNVDLSLSFGAFRSDRLVGFILNSAGIYQDQPVVFDAGTGIIPEHRGKKVFSGLFDHTCRQLKTQGITRYCLEVLQSNHHAAAIYRKKGFHIQREYSVLTASGTGPGCIAPVSVTDYSDFVVYSTRYSVEPSFEHTDDTIKQNPQLFEVMHLRDQAYCIYAKKNGEIIQMHYNEPGPLREVMCAVISRYPSAMAKNVDCSCTEVIRMLKEIGFKEILKQYEMAKDI